MKDLEGFAASLSQTGGLDPEKHDVIASSLERDLTKRLNIPKEKEKVITGEEDSLLKESEAYFIRRK